MEIRWAYKRGRGIQPEGRGSIFEILRYIHTGEKGEKMIYDMIGSLNLPLFDYI